MWGQKQQWISHQINIRHAGQRTIEKIKILGAVLELPAKQHWQTSPFTTKLGQIYVKFIATCALTFLGVLFQSQLVCINTPLKAIYTSVYKLYKSSNIDIYIDKNDFILSQFSLFSLQQNMPGHKPIRFLLMQQME